MRFSKTSQKFEKSYWDFVEEKYGHHYNFTSILSVLERQTKWIRRHARALDGKARVLDVGCGFGFFLRLCDELRWETHGVDISYYAINMARRNTNAQLHLHDIQDARKSPFKENYFDLVTMFEVLEHLNSPIIALREAKRILKSDGKLMITTPNLSAIERIALKLLAKEKRWHGLNDKTHTNLLTPASLKALVKVAGLEILELKTPFSSVPCTVNRILEKTGLGGQIWLLAQKI